MGNFKKIEQKDWISIFSGYLSYMLHTLIKLKLFKLSLLSALSAGIVITLIAKEIRKNKNTDEANE